MPQAVRPTTLSVVTWKLGEFSRVMSYSVKSVLSSICSSRGTCWLRPLVTLR